jgi:hypothetical protein
MRKSVKELLRENKFFGMTARCFYLEAGILDSKFLIIVSAIS